MTAAGGSVALATAPPASAAGAPVTIAMVCSCSGLAGSAYQGAEGAYLARIKVANADGGVHGHSIVPLFIDDQSNPGLDASGVQEAIAKGAKGIVAVSALFYEGAKYAQQAGIPVTGAYTDGPEWGTQPNTNMFASDLGSVNPKYPVNAQIGKFLVSHGGTVVGSYGYGVSPSSARSAVQTADSVKHAGGSVGVLDTTVPFGTVDFGSIALTAKSKGINGLSGAMLNNSNFALATALKQAGVKLKAVAFATGYEPDVVHSPVWPDVQGYDFESIFRPFSLPNAGTQQMQAALIKYDKFTKSRFPTINEYEAWLGADLMIKGMQESGSKITTAGTIKALRSTKSYNGNGLLPQPINYSTIFGHDLPQECGWFMEAEAKGFVAVSSQPTCGTDIPGTSTAS
jgi:ABC-type branched-subunit amino acid transport system substrate-binding protein